MRTARIWFIFVLAVLSQTGVSLSAPTALDRGLAAAKQERWDAAIKYFTEAQEQTPYDPQVLFNLGLAYAKAGREIMAITWFKAYLAASPSAENAAQVRQEIVNLEIANEARREKLYSAAMDVFKAMPVPDDKKMFLSPTLIFTAQAAAGDMEGAVKAATLYGPVDSVQVWGEPAEPRLGYSSKKAAEDYAVKLAEEGDIKSALELIDKNPDADRKKVLVKALEFYLHEGYNLDEALKTAAMIPDVNKESAYGYLIEALAAAGRLKDATALTEKIPDTSERFRIWLRISSAQSLAGTLPEAFKSVQTAAALIPQPDDNQIISLAREYISCKELAAAEDVLKNLKAKSIDDSIMGSLAVAYWDKGDTVSAKKWADKILTEKEKFAYFLKTGDLSRAEPAAQQAVANPFWPGFVAAVWAELRVAKLKNKTNPDLQDVVSNLPKMDVDTNYYLKYVAWYFAKEGKIPQALRVLGFIQSSDPMFLEMPLYFLVGYYLDRGSLQEAGTLLEKYNDSFFPELYSRQWIKLLLRYSDACIAAGKTGQAVIALKNAKKISLANNLSDYVIRINEKLSGLKAAAKDDRMTTELWVGLAKTFAAQKEIADTEEYLAGLKAHYDQDAIYSLIADVGKDMAARLRQINRISQVLETE